MSEMAPDSEVFASDYVYVPVVLVQQTPTAVAATTKAKKDGSGVRTDKGFKEVHLNTVAKQAIEFCGQDVSATQVYNHMRKWRGGWIQVSKLRDLSGTTWDENTCSKVLKAEHYVGHVVNHPRDAEFLNTPIHNYSQMQHIFSFGLATGKHAMGSREPLGSPMPDFPTTPDVEVIDGLDKPFDKPFDPIHDRKRKRGGMMEEEINVFFAALLRQ
ncbi:Translational activator GCN1 [Hordeum vulgare]|nr:Translational activator GCN1 [Hordeum vulgare]